VRKRRWVLHILLLILALTILLPRAWRWTRMDDKAKQFLLARMQPVLGDAFAIDRVSISFANIHLLGLYLPPGEQPFSVRIEDLRIGINPIRMFRYGMDPRAFSQDIMIKKPVVLIRTAPGAPARDAWPQGEKIRLYLHNLQRLDFLKMASIQEGAVALERDGREPFPLITGLKGWLINENPDTLLLRLSGHPLGARQSLMTLEGRFGLEEGGLDTIQTTFSRLPLSRLLTPGEDREWLIHSGEAEADISLALRPDREYQPNLSGWIRVANLAASWPERHLRCDHSGITLRLQEGRVEVERSALWINQTSMSLTGAITGPANPHLQLTLSAPEIDAGSFRDTLPEELRGLTGQVALNVDLEGPLASPQLRFGLLSTALHLRDELFEEVSLNANWTGDSLQVQSLRGRWRGLDIEAVGALSGIGDSTSLEGRLNAAGELLPLLPPAYTGSLRQARLSLAAALSGPAAAPDAQGSLSLSLANHTGGAMTSESRFLLRDRRFQINPAGGPDEGIRGVIDWSGEEPRFALNLPDARSWLEMLWPAPAGAMRQRGLDFSLHLNHLGGHYALQARLLHSRPGRPVEELFALSSRLERLDGGWQGIGTTTLWPDQTRAVRGHFSLAADSMRVSLRDWTMGEWFSGILQIGRSGSLSGSCFLQDFPVELLGKGGAETPRGILDGELLITGTTRQPRLHTTLRLQEGRYRSAGPFESEGALTLAPDGVVLERLLLTSEENTLLFANGWYRSGADSLFLRLQGAGFEMLRLSPALLPGVKPLTGQTVADLVLSGTLRRPLLSGRLRIQNGSCYGIAFDDLEARFGPEEGAAPLPSAGEAPRLNLQRLAVHRKGILELAARGSLPLRGDDEIDISLQGTGNFLALLSDLNPWFEESASEGRLSARLGGSWGRPRISDARLSVRHGMLKFESVLPTVSELSADLAFRPDEQFIQIEEMQARIGGRPVRIRSQLSRPGLAERPLENLVFPQWGGLNFGVLSLENGPQGVEVNILGLMERGKFGTIWLEGRRPGEAFYCAGPINRPLFRGLIKAANTEFMFPFDETLPPMEDGIVYNVLMSAEWDVAVRVLEDVRYVKFLPGGLDKVYTNILIEEGGEDIDFTGVTNDSTFRILGQARTSSGVIEYLDMTFRIEQGGARWDRASLYPVTWGQARTTVTDSLGFTSQIFLTVQTVDATMEKKEVDDIVRQEERRGRWDQIRFKLSSDNPNLGTTEAQLLASLGYSERTLQTKAMDVIGINTDNYLLRPFFKPVERTIEHFLQLDYVRFSSRFTRNFLDANLNNNLQVNSRLALLRSSRLILGKYLSRNVFLQYTGQVEAGVEYRYQSRGLGLRHSLGLEYRISPQVLLELEYNYDSLMLYNRDDKRIMVRHWFPF